MTQCVYNIGVPCSTTVFARIFGVVIEITVKQWEIYVPNDKERRGQTDKQIQKQVCDVVLLY